MNMSYMMAQPWKQTFVMCELWGIQKWVLSDLPFVTSSFLVFKLCLLLDGISLLLWYMHLLYFLAIHHTIVTSNQSCSTRRRACCSCIEVYKHRAYQNVKILSCRVLRLNEMQLFMGYVDNHFYFRILIFKIFFLPFLMLFPFYLLLLCVVFYLFHFLY